MNKVELVKNVATKTGYTQKDIKTVMEAMQEATFEALAAHDEVKLMDGVTLNTVYRESRVGRNPKTGEEITVPAKYAVRCKFGKPIKEAING